MEEIKLDDAAWNSWEKRINGLLKEYQVVKPRLKKVSENFSVINVPEYNTKKKW